LVILLNERSRLRLRRSFFLTLTSAFEYRMRRRRDGKERESFREVNR
jgi:hypothetical protein